MRKIIIILLLFISALVVIGVFALHKYPRTYTKVEGIATITLEQLYKESFIDEKYKNPPQILFNEAEYISGNTFDISSRHSFAVDLANNRVLFSKDAHQRVPVASLVKIMTGVVALEHASPDKEIIVSEKAADTGENSMGLSSGEVYSLKELLYGLILNSGNDAAIAIAEGVSGSEENFVAWMNFKANELGLKDTKFVDPNGLNLKDENYYSSAYDLAVITKYSLDNFELLREIYKTFSMEFYETDKHKYIYLENQTNLLTTYPGVKGIKTGYTDESGWGLITYAENGDAKILGVILDAVNRKYDGILLLDYCFGKEGIEIYHNLL